MFFYPPGRPPAVVLNPIDTRNEFLTRQNPDPLLILLINLS
jgi:hypothetical protein